MTVAEDSEAAGGATVQATDVAQSAGANARSGRRPGDVPEGTVFMSRTKSFTRRSRELPVNLARTWEAHADRYVIEPRRGVGYTTVADDFHLDAEELFGRQAPLTLEIGSGTGEQIVAAAAANPDRDYLALEVWVPGIAKLISKAVDAGVDNIRVLEADVAQALPIMLGDACLDEVWTFFPDPWRKARHRKRRLVSDEFALQIARVLRDEGVWRLATDWDDYAWQLRDAIEGCPLFVYPYVGQRPDPEDPEPERGCFAPRYEGRVVTHFETRGIDAGRRVHDIVGVRLPRESA